jgi:hypothetical protein
VHPAVVMAVAVDSGGEVADSGGRVELQFGRRRRRVRRRFEKQALGLGNDRGGVKMRRGGGRRDGGIWNPG